MVIFSFFPQLSNFLIIVFLIVSVLLAMLNIAIHNDNVLVSDWTA